MSNFTASIRHGFSNLTNFEGRDRPRQFWPYALLLVGSQWLIGMALTVPMMIDAMKSSFAAVGDAARAGGQVDQMQLQADMMQQVMGQAQAILPYTMALNIIAAALLVAATVRRLHDRDWSGWWVMLALGSMAIGFITSYWAMDLVSGEPQAIMDNMGTLQLLGWLPLIGYIVLIIQLVQGGSNADNRFGPPPA